MAQTKLFVYGVLSYLIALQPIFVFAETVPPPVRTSDSGPVATALSKPVSKLKMGNLVVEFERMTLAQIRDTVGVGKIDHQGDAGESIYWICYSIPNQPVYQRIWISSGEMGGSEHSVNSVQALQSEMIKPSDGCPVLPQRFLPIQFGKNLRLNEPLTSLENILGKPSTNKQDLLTYKYKGKKSALYEGKLVEYDVSSLFEVQIKEGVVTSITAIQVTSY